MHNKINTYNIIRISKSKSFYWDPKSKLHTEREKNCIFATRMRMSAKPVFIYKKTTVKFGNGSYKLNKYEGHSFFSTLSKFKIIQRHQGGSGKKNQEK